MNHPSERLWLVRGIVVWVLLPALAIPLLGGWLVPVAPSDTVVSSGGALLAALASRWLPLLLLSAAATWLAHGGSDCLAGLRFALGLREPRLRAARRSLSTAARTAVWAGIALCLLPFLGLARFLGGSTDMNPLHAHQGISSTLILPIGVILFGRIALACAADRAAALSGEPGRRVFPGWQDLALFVLLLTATMSLLMMFLSFPGLEDAR